MKHWTRSGALLLAAALALSLSACGTSEPVPEEILDRTEENIGESLNSLSTTVSAQIDLELLLEDQPKTLSFNSVLDSISFSKPFKIRADTTLSLNGRQLAVVTVYAQQEEEDYPLYIYRNGQWIRETADPAMVQDYQSASGGMSTYFQGVENWTYQEKTEMDGQTFLVFTGTLNDSLVSALLENNGISLSLEFLYQLGADPGQVQTLLEAPGEATIEMWIDPDLCYPVRYRLDIAGPINTALDPVFQALDTLLPTDSGDTIRYSQAEIIMSYSHLNAAPDFTIPQEALEA